MRMMMRVHFDPSGGSAALKSGAAQKAIGGFIEKFKPEATYFTEVDGERAGFFVFDMKSSDQMPEIAEAMFDLGARVHVAPCMTPDDLKNGLIAAGLG